MQKVALLKVFHHTAKAICNCDKRADMFDRVKNSLNAGTQKLSPQNSTFNLISLQPVKS